MNFTYSDLIPYIINDNDNDDMMTDTIILSNNILCDIMNSIEDDFSTMQFKITFDNKNVTHAACVEFTAIENTIGLSHKVINSIFGEYIDKTNIDNKINELGLCKIEKVELKKVSEVLLMPLLRVNGKELFNINNIKNCLEENLNKHYTMSINDIISVWYRGDEYVLKVIDQKPDMYGSLINTDVTVEFGDENVIKAKEEIRKKEEAKEKRKEYLHLLDEDTTITNPITNPNTICMDMSVKICIDGKSYIHKFNRADSILTLFKYLQSIMGDDVCHAKVQNGTSVFSLCECKKEDTFTTYGFTNNGHSIRICKIQ